MNIRYGISSAFSIVLFASVLQAQLLDWTKRETRPMNQAHWILQAGYLDGADEVVSAGADGRIRIWEATTGNLKKELHSGKDAACLSMAAPPGGEWIAVGDSLGLVQIWDPNNAKLIREIQADKSGVNALSVSSDGKMAAAGGSEGIVRIFSADNAELIREFTPGEGRVVSLAFAPDPELIAVGVLDTGKNKQTGEVSVWNWKSRKKLFGMPSSPGIRGLSVSPDGRYLAGYFYKPLVRLYIFVTGESSAEVSLRVLKESYDPEPLAVWDLKSKKMLASGVTELGTTSISFSPDSRLLAVGGNHGVMLYAIRGVDLVEKGRLESRTPIDSLAFSSDGKSILLAQRDPVSPEQAVQLCADPEHIQAVEMYFNADPAGGGRPMPPGGSRLEIWDLRENVPPYLNDLEQAARLAQTGQIKASISALNKLTEKYPDEPEVLRSLSVATAMDGDMKGAILSLEKSAENKPSSAMLFRSLGDLYSSTGQWAQAIDAYKKALDLNPEFGLVRGRLAIAYSRLAVSYISASAGKDRLRQSISLLEESKRLAPDEAFVYRHIGVCFGLLEEYERAIQSLWDALELQPDYVRVYYDLGGCYKSLGKKEEAVEAYQKYISIGEKDSEVRIENARRHMESIKKELSP